MTTVQISTTRTTRLRALLGKVVHSLLGRSARPRFCEVETSEQRSQADQQSTNQLAHGAPPASVSCA